jgi:hypothetical protein
MRSMDFSLNVGNFNFISRSYVPSHLQVFFAWNKTTITIGLPLVLQYIIALFLGRGSFDVG